MENREQKAQKRTEGEEDLLNFDLDDLSLEDVDQAAAGEEGEVIELTDLVEKGVVRDQEGQDEIARLLEEEGAGGGTAEIELGTKELAGLDGILKEEGKGKDESVLEIEDLSLDFSEDKQAPVEENVVAEERVLEEVISEADLAAAVEARAVEGPAAVPAQEQAEPRELVLDLLEEAAVEQEPLAPPAAEKPQAVPEAPALAPVETAPVQAAAAQPPVPAGVEISEEKLEAIVTRVVQDVVERVAREVLERVAERVARETMAEVAERVISQAIDALRQSLESPSN